MWSGWQAIGFLSGSAPMGGGAPEFAFSLETGEKMSADEFGDTGGDEGDRTGARANGPVDLVFSRAVLARIWTGQHRLQQKLRNAKTAGGGRRNG